MKIILTLTLAILSFSLFAQNTTVEVTKITFDRKIQPENSTIELNAKLLLIVNDKLSFFNKTFNTEETNTTINTDDDSSFLFTPSDKNINLVYKDYTKNNMLSKGEIAFKYLVVQDSINIFKWKLLNQTKQLLGYSCQLAKLSFRGRQYNAWFTSELPVGGPWKFDGLPGMILQIESEKPYISFVATSISNTNIKHLEVEKPFQKEKKYNWQQFKNLYKKKAIALSKYSTESGESGGIAVPRIGIERYIEENDPDYTLGKKLN